MPRKQQPINTQRPWSARIERNASSSSGSPNVLPAWIAMASAIVAAVAALAGVYWTSYQSNQQSVLDRRAAAYAEYLGTFAEFNELVWAASAWAGQGAPQPQPTDSGVFWSSAAQLQAELEADYAQAAMATTDSEVLVTLDSLRREQGQMFVSFKCAAQLQQADCIDTSPATNAEIIELLRGWTEGAEQDKATLITIARTQLN